MFASFAYPLLTIIGLCVSGSMIPMAVALMGASKPPYRGRVMGVRMLAVYGQPLWLVAAGALFEQFGIVPTMLIFGLGGLIPVTMLAAAWRRHVAG